MFLQSTKSISDTGDVYIFDIITDNICCYSQCWSDLLICLLQICCVVSSESSWPSWWFWYLRTQLKCIEVLWHSSVEGQLVSPSSWFLCRYTLKAFIIRMVDTPVSALEYISEWNICIYKNAYRSIEVVSMDVCSATFSVMHRAPI